MTFLRNNKTSFQLVGVPPDRFCLDDMADDSSARRLRTLLGHLQGGCASDLALQPTHALSGSWQVECAGENHRLCTVSASPCLAGSGLRYTLDGCILTPEQRRFYEDQGYLVIPRLVSEDDLDAYRERFLKLCRKEVKVRS